MALFTNIAQNLLSQLSGTDDLEQAKGFISAADAAFSAATILAEKKAVAAVALAAAQQKLSAAQQAAAAAQAEVDANTAILNQTV